MGYNTGGLEPTETTTTTCSASSALETVQENTRRITTTLRVHPEHGAGIDLVPENGGMRVENICEVPGQPDLLPKDLIIAINEVPLVGAPEMVEDTFGRHFGDGVQISAKR